MAITSILTTDGEIRAKGGANVSTAITDQQYDDWVLQKENLLNVFTRRNWSDDFGGLNVDVKFTLSDAVSSLVGIESIAFDMSGYTSRAEAESMINVLRDNILRILSLLRNKQSETFIDGTT